MIFENIDFHNVEEIEPCEKGYLLWRVPASVRRRLNEQAAQLVSRCSTGVELRFRLKGDSATVLLCADEAQECQAAYLYHGSFQGTWRYSSKHIGTAATRITIPKPGNLDVLREITKEKNLPFDPAVIRIVLPYGNCYFVGIEGEVEPPGVQELPGKTYLAYGSSITHGSLALAPPYSYPFRLAQKMNCDYLNLGFAGTAQLERSMAEYLVSRKDWDFASVELGINMIGEAFSEKLFEERVKDFVEVLAADARPVFATSLFGIRGENQGKASRYREIVRRYASGRLHFIDGLELLNHPAYLSQDLIHPSLEGMEEIVNRWHPVMEKVLASQL
jgi:hypothetical protein